LENRFHKRQVSFLVVKTVKCKRGNTEPPPNTGTVDEDNVSYNIYYHSSMLACLTETGRINTPGGNWLINLSIDVIKDLSCSYKQWSQRKHWNSQKPSLFVSL